MTRWIAAGSLLGAVLLTLASGSPPAGADPAEEAAPPPKPCSAPEARQFDFWIGEWDVTWQGGKATNTVRSILGGCVIEENFDGAADAKLVGQSYSVYNANTGMWQQTWVDNNGGYLDFVGEFQDGKMTLWRDAERGGKKFKQRMVFSDITDDSLLWSWERSDDDGATWKPTWVLNYTRRK